MAPSSPRRDMAVLHSIAYHVILDSASPLHLGELET